MTGVTQERSEVQEPVIIG